MNLFSLFKKRKSDRPTASVKAPERLKWKDTEGSLNSEKDLTGRFCSRPFVKYAVQEDGLVYSCCASWLRLPIGDLRKQDADALWNSEESKAIRASIHDGSFRYCDRKLCPEIQNDNLPTVEQARKDPEMAALIDNEVTILEDGPGVINFSNDSSCNLACPSCRVEKIMHTAGPEFDKRKALNDKVRKAFFETPTDRTFTINVTGSGDPFGSRLFREFLFSLDGASYPNMKVDIQTNGVMFTQKNWDKLEKIHANLSQFF